MFLSIPENTEKKIRYQNKNKLKCLKVRKSKDENLVDGGNDEGVGSCVDGDDKHLCCESNFENPAQTTIIFKS